MAKRAYFTKEQTGLACEDDEPIRQLWSHQVTPKVGFDKMKLEFPNDVIAQTQIILDSIDAAFCKANLSIGQTNSMNVWVRTMKDKSAISDCIRHAFTESPKSIRTSQGLDDLIGVSFRYADFEDARVLIMIDADEYHGR